MQAHGGSKAGKRAGRVIDDGFHNMDCCQGFNLTDDKSIDLILCDLPFGTTQNERGYKSRREHTGRIMLFGMMKGEKE